MNVLMVIVYFTYGGHVAMTSEMVTYKQCWKAVELFEDDSKIRVMCKDLGDKL